MGMLSDKGPEYTAAWPGRIARQHQCSPAYVIRALNRVTGATVDEQAAYLDELIPEIGALTPAQGRAVVAEVKRQMDAITQHEKIHCNYCGLRLNRRGQCDECV